MADGGVIAAVRCFNDRAGSFTAPLPEQGDATAGRALSHLLS